MGFDFFILIQFILAISILAFFHELGHFMMAKFAGVEVEEFGLGLPPRMVKLFTWRETEFTLNALPFGAFVRPKGENNPDIPGGLAYAPPIKRLGVLLGGPIMNLILGALIFSIIFKITGTISSIDIRLQKIELGSPAEISGLQIGDIIREVNGKQVNRLEDISKAVNDNAGEEMEMVIDRGGKSFRIAVIPRINPPEGQGRLGIVMEANPIYEKVTAIKAFGMGISEVGYLARELVMVPVRLIEGVIAPDQARVVSIVGMFQMYQQVSVAEEQTSSENPNIPRFAILQFLGIISIALGLTNLLPLPALDGGRILFLIPEIVFRRRVPQKFENAVHAIGMSSLLVLMVILIVNDLINPIVIR